MSANALALQMPQSTAAYVANIFAKEIRYEFVKMLRTRAFSLSVLGFPIMFYLLFGASNRHTDWARYLMASYGCMGVVSACLFGIGMGISMERAYGWLELKQASPMPRLAYLAAKIVSSAAFALIIELALIGLALTLGGVHVTVSETLRLLGVDLLGSVPFTAMGLLISVLVPSNSAPGIINLIYLPMSFASGFWMPISTLPHWLQRVAPALPTYHLAQLALSVIGAAEPGHMMPHFQALAGYTLVMFGAAWIIFNRSEARA
ncbi:ABC transporter permease [Occallatibacter savannae]|uniref:ABC transporter permease n=1 Tax=Occallatibacter savannae TaxID=1002691 RepID=UPI000D69719F|nr:ABC transporter permease [Occallatibacter savannae]